MKEDNSIKIQWKAPLFAAVCMLSMSLFTIGCAGGGGDSTQSPAPSTSPTLHQAAFNPTSGSYQYGYNSISNLVITGAPVDTDWSRWAMLHDGADYRLYFFKTGANDTIYQFAYNPLSTDYEYGYNSISTLTITGIPADADSNSFSMLHDGTTYRLYMHSISNPAMVYQFGFNPASANYEYGYSSLPQINIVGAPIDVDWSRWAMLHDGVTYRYYAFQQGSNTNFYQFGFNPASANYEYGYSSIPNLTVESMPAASDKTSFAMLHDGLDYRLYFKQ